VDPLLSVLVALLILRSAWSLEHIHIWSVTPERPILTLNAFIDPCEKIEPVAEQIKTRLHEEFHIDHATIDVARDH